MNVKMNFADVPVNFVVTNNIEQITRCQAEITGAVVVHCKLIQSANTTIRQLCTRTNESKNVILRLEPGLWRIRG